MTKKDYLKIAKVFSDKIKENPNYDLDIIFETADMLKKDNPKFKRELFYQVSGLIKGEHYN